MACNILQIWTDVYATCSCSPIYSFLCTVLVTLPRLGQTSYYFDDSRTLCTHQYLYARRSALSDRFHNVPFTMQSHDQNSTLSLRSSNQHRLPWDLNFMFGREPDSEIEALIWCILTCFHPKWCIKIKLLFMKASPRKDMTAYDTVKLSEIRCGKNHGIVYHTNNRPIIQTNKTTTTKTTNIFH